MSDPLVLAAKVALINRVNEVYNDDVAYKFLLVAGTDTKLNLITAAETTGAERPVRRQRLLHAPTRLLRLRRRHARAATTSCSASSSGADNFDIGHIGLGVNGGGIAGLGVVGGDEQGRRLHRPPAADR